MKKSISEGVKQRDNTDQIKHSLLVLILGVKCKGLSVDQLLHLFLSQCVLLKIKAEGCHAHRLITDVMQRC